MFLKFCKCVHSRLRTIWPFRGAKCENANSKNLKRNSSVVLNRTVVDSDQRFDICQSELYCVRCIRSSLYYTDLNLQVHFISLSDFTDILTFYNTL